MDGYVRFTLSKSPAENWVDEGRVWLIWQKVINQEITLWSFYFQPECYYKGFRDEEGQLTPVHWYFIYVFNLYFFCLVRYILTLKFAFVIIFEHFVFGVCKLIDIMVPDIPYSLDIKIKRERYLAKQALQVFRNIMRITIYLFLLRMQRDQHKHKMVSHHRMYELVKLK